jgi:hypothetical protein
MQGLKGVVAETRDVLEFSVGRKSVNISLIVSKTLFLKVE